MKGVKNLTDEKEVKKTIRTTKSKKVENNDKNNEKEVKIPIEENFKKNNIENVIEKEVIVDLKNNEIDVKNENEVIDIKREDEVVDIKDKKLKIIYDLFKNNEFDKNLEVFLNEVASKISNDFDYFQYLFYKEVLQLLKDIKELLKKNGTISL